MSQVLGRIPKTPHPDLLVGFDTCDDAGVFRLSAETALVQTVDFFTPMVDDPYAFGTIAAANALSDVYAMGAVPLTGLNIVGYPVGKMPLSVLEQILKGGADKAREAGVTLLGGHTVDDEEPKFGMAVTGLVHPDRVVTNAGARPGDRLILTKPIGVGIVTTAIKRDLASADLVARVTRSMQALNKAAGEAMVAVGAHACTDITGFGLLGHLHELIAGSGTAARLHVDRVPRFDEALAFAQDDVVPGGSRQNLTHLASCLQVAAGISRAELLLLADAQTSGGLLMAVPPERVDAMTRALDERGVLAAEVGTILEASPTLPVGTLEIAR